MQMPMDEEIEVEEMDGNPNDEILIPSDPYEGLSYKKLAIRLGIVIYVSLGLFPILVQIFHSLFASNDYEHIFANQDLFIACMISAIVWTVPILFLYFNHPRSKLTVKICFAIEFLRIALYCPSFIGYFKSEEVSYSVRVFIFFILLDCIRYIFLFTSIRPIFKLDVPEAVNDDEDYT